MKHILMILLLGFVSLQAQDREPNAWKFVWGHDTIPRIFHPDSVTQKSVITGFQWSGSLQMNNALLNNSCAGSTYWRVPQNSRRYKLNFVTQPTWQNGSGWHVGTFYSPYMQYEPTLVLTDANKGTIIRPADSSDPIFGFMYRRGTISDNPSDPNYSRLVLTKADKPTYGGDIVLDSIWPNPHFKSTNPVDMGGQSDKYRGKIWYLTINLRRLNPATETIRDDSVVLSIKLPYIQGDGSTGFIRFNKLPVNHPDSVTNLKNVEDRGYAQNTYEVTPSTSEFKITRNMIPASPKDYQNITISAEFKTVFTSDSILQKYNPGFTQSNVADSFLIKDIDIQVKYFGKLDIAIDYIRIESIRANIFLRGIVDSLKPYNYGRDGRGKIDIYDDPDFPKELSQPNDIKYVIQTCIDSIKAKSNNWQDAELFRFYYQDTETDEFYWWGPLRYMNKITNGMYITRDNVQYPDLYNYYTKCPNRWIGFVFGSQDGLMPAPYARTGVQDWQTIGLKSGYFQHGNSHNFPDTLNSQYETSAGPVSLWADDHHYFNHILDSNECLQPRWERTLYDVFFNKNKRNDRLIFTNGHWWVYHLLYNMGMDTLNKLYYGTYRPKTGEEIRMVIYSALLKGCKGFLLDGDQNTRFPNHGLGQMGLGDFTLLNDTNNLYSDWVGTDFIDSVHNTWNAFSYIDPDIIAQYMQTPRNRAYIGPKSIRTELYKIHSIIRAEDTTLINLRLAALLCKGYRALYSQDSLRFGNDTLLKKYIILNPNNIRTRRIGHQQYEPWDSSFFDITLLAHKTDTLVKEQTFYIGIQNRRTDPLLYAPDTLDKVQPYDSVNTSMKFYSTAEFDEKARFGGKTIHGTFHDSLWWRDKYWKRQACREIAIPFNYKLDTLNYFKIKIREMGIGTTLESDTSAWWFHEPYRDVIDTVIENQGYIIVRLLPGEGKFLRVDIDYNYTKGELEYSNQRKMVAYPVSQSSITAFGDTIVRYHMVYHKPTTDIGYRYKVFYKRSQPVGRGASPEQVIWEPEIDLSDSVYAINNYGQQSFLFTDAEAKHPSIVVRYNHQVNPPQPYAYVVYHATDHDKPFDTVYVIENMFPANAPIINKNLPSGYAIARVNRQLPYVWDSIGVPTVNASYSGNYYAWDDPVDGIVAGWKEPSSRYFASPNHKLNLRYRTSSISKAKHPCLNTYSRVRLGENDCAIVWQEDTTGSGWAYHIFYTRLKMENGYLSNYLADYFASSDYPPPVIARDSIIRLSDYSPTVNNVYPVLYRAVEDYPIRYDGQNTISDSLYKLRAHHDRVFWQKNRTDYISYDIGECIYGRAIDIIDTAVYSQGTYRIIPAGWVFYLPFKIYSLGQFSYLANPNISQGYLRNINLNWRSDANQGDSITVLNFIQYTYTQPRADNSVIWNLLLGHWGLISGVEYDLMPVQQYQNARLTSNAGIYPQLCALPYVRIYDDAKYNKRLFNTGESSIFQIPLSNEYLYRQDHESSDAAYVFFGFSNNNGKTYLTPALTDNDYEIEFLPLKAKERNGDYITTLDTIRSAWFNVDNIQTLHFFGYGSDDMNKIRIKIQRESDGRIKNLPFSFSTTNIRKNRLNLLNGNNQRYRILWIKNDSTSFYTEELVVGGLPNVDEIDQELDTSRFSRVIDREDKFTVDLSEDEDIIKSDGDITLLVYPNPADKVIYATAYIPQSNAYGRNKSNTNLILKVYSNSGSELFRQEVKPGETISIPTDKLSHGAYFIRAEEKVNSWDNPLLPVMKSFIIER